MFATRNADVRRRALKTVEGLPLKGAVTMKPLMQAREMTMMELHYPTGSGSPLHIHQHESVCYVVKGRVRMMVAGETHILEAGDACVHPQGVPHGIEAVEDATVVEVKSPAQPLEQFLGTA